MADPQPAGRPRFSARARRFHAWNSTSADEALMRKYGSDNWYDWCMKNWGTKWDIEAVLEDEGEGQLVYSFDSAWSPPVAWLVKVAKDHPQLGFRLRYDEPAMGFTGMAIARGGKVNDQCTDY